MFITFKKVDVLFCDPPTLRTCFNTSHISGAASVSTFCLFYIIETGRMYFFQLLSREEGPVHFNELSC